MSAKQDKPLPPVAAYTRRSSYVTAVRRMKAEKEFGLPISERSSFAISPKIGKHANEMSEQEWETFYDALCEVVRKDYPEQYAELFGG